MSRLMNENGVEVVTVDLGVMTYDYYSSTRSIKDIDRIRYIICRL